MNIMMQRHIIGKPIPLLSTIENDLLKQKARKDFDKEVLARHEAKVKKYKERNNESNNKSWRIRIRSNQSKG